MTGKPLTLKVNNLANSGALKVTGGAALNLSGPLMNTGSVDVGTGLVTLLYGAGASFATLLTLPGTGTLMVQSVMDLGGSTLTSGSMPAFASVSVQDGTLKNGTIQQGEYLSLIRGTFDGTAWTNGLVLARAGNNAGGSGAFTIRNGLSVTGGALDLRSSNSTVSMLFDGNQTLSNMQTLMCGSSGSGLGNGGYNYQSQTLTLDATSALTGSGGKALLSNGAIVNNCAITNNGAVTVAADGRAMAPWASPSAPGWTPRPSWPRKAR